MKISHIEIHLIRVPFDMGAAPKVFAGMNWTSVDSLFVRIRTDEGIDGWGEGWGHVACPTTMAALSSLVGPAFVGRDALDREKLMDEMQHRFHIHGRTGPVAYALSAIEIALWDIAGKAASKPIASLLGGKPCELKAYASLLRYSEPSLVATAVERALGQGFEHIKLHEERLDAVQAARQAAGASTWLTLDTNCPWSVPEAIERAHALEAFQLAWLEEPVWPPEDHAGLARVQAEGRIPTAAGENAMLPEFRSLFEAGALTYAQPSVTKVGGVTQMRKVMALAEAFGIDVVPHSAYFGPGLLASIHCIAAMPKESIVERYDADFDVNPLHDAIEPGPNGCIAVPQGAGLGIDPDPIVIAKQRVG